MDNYEINPEHLDSLLSNRLTQNELASLYQRLSNSNYNDTEAFEAVCLDIILDCHLQNKQINELEIQDELQKRVVDHILSNMVAEGLIDHEFDIEKNEFVFSLTDKGKELASKLH